MTKTLTPRIRKPLDIQTSDANILHDLDDIDNVNLSNFSQRSSTEASSPNLKKNSGGISRWHHLNLRLKATLLGVALGTLPLVLVGGGAVYLTNQSLSEDIIAENNAASLELTNTLNSFLYERFSDIEAVANLPSLKDPKIIGNLSASERADILTSYASTYGIYESIAAFDLNGNVITQSRGKQLANIANRDYFKQVVRSGQRVVSPPEISGETGQYVMYYATALKDPSGKVMGVVQTAMPLQEGFKDLLGIFKTEERNFFILNDDGKVIHAGNTDAIGKSSRDIWKDINLLSTPGSFEFNRDYNSLSRTNTTVASRYTEDYRDMPNLDWNVISEVPADIAYQSQRNLLFALLAGTAAAAVLVATVASYLAKQVTQPIQETAIAVTEMGQGNLGVRLNIKGQDELAALGKNINMMAADLEKLLDDQKAEAGRLETAKNEARAEADKLATEQKAAKEALQKRALELLMEVDPVSRGDLTIRASVTPDEIGTVADSYNAIIKSLGGIVRDVKGAVLTVTQTAEDNESSVQKVAQDALVQLESLANVVEQINNLTLASESVTERAQLAKQQVELANQVVSEGDIAMDKTVAGITSIRDTVSETAKKVKRLGEASQKISQVVNLIGDFAAQTNLLALNAAIEAARAGEEGRGFSVVAEEVRALAQQSADATADIEKLVEEIQAQTNTVVVAMEEGTEQVVTGTKLVEESREKLNQITAVSTKVNDIIQEISNSAVEQTNISTQIGRTMEEFSSIASETSKQSTDVAQSFGKLLDVAKGLQGRIEQFKVS
ncbi:MAG: HAMP domain-containing protein [Acaryochloridaceae cyanobacterium RL_2_7]|nr:HAMP domain-containing protein [Acaryochloridaceae cyanobacterium RL_2_7]